MFAGCAAPPAAPESSAHETQTSPATQPASAGKIGEFTGPYRFLSNFSPAQIELEGITYPTVEHAYQAAKTLDRGERLRIAALPTPAEAKRAGRALPQRADWETAKFQVMEQCVREKFMRHADLRAALLATGEAYLEEGNTWGDQIWGVYQGKGDNRLGKILMKIRAELAAGSTQPASLITLDGAKELQTIDGFGASTFGGFELFERGGFDDAAPRGVTYHTTAEQRKELIAAAVRELGVTHARIWIWSGVEPQNDNDDPDVIDWNAFTWEGRSGRPAGSDQLDSRMNGLKEWGEWLTQAIKLGLVNWIPTPGELPDWLLKRIKDKNDPRRFDEYAEWAAAQLLYLKKTFGLEAPYWSMFNEPDVRGWTSPDLWRPWLKATGERFRREGLKTKIMFPDFMNVHEAVKVTEAVLQDEQVRPFIGALAYHHYRSSGDGPQPFLKAVSSPQTADAGKLFERLTIGARQMAELGRKYNLPSWQTETAYYPKNIAGLSEWEIGRGRANEIYYELLSGASAVQGMLAIWIDAIDPRYNQSVRSEGHHIVMTTDGRNMSRWQITKDAGAVFAHYARFVRPGDRHIAAACDDPWLRVSAFVVPRLHGYVAVVINNASEPRNVRIRLNNARWQPAHAAGLLTDSTITLASHPITTTSDPAAFTAILPALSLTTFVWSQEPLAPLTLPSSISLR